MKKVLTAFILFALVSAAVWAVTGRKKDTLSQYILQEQPVSGENQKKLMSVRKSLTEMCVKREWKKLEKCFSLSRTERMQAKQESGEDPVEKYLTLLEDYTPDMQKSEWEMTELVKNQNHVIFRIAGEKGKRLCIDLTKRKGKYFFHSVTEEQPAL